VNVCNGRLVVLAFSEEVVLSDLVGLAAIWRGVAGPGLQG